MECVIHLPSQSRCSVGEESAKRVGSKPHLARGHVLAHFDRSIRGSARAKELIDEPRLMMMSGCSVLVIDAAHHDWNKVFAIKVGICRGRGIDFTFTEPGTKQKRFVGTVGKDRYLFFVLLAANRFTQQRVAQFSLSLQWLLKRPLTLFMITDCHI